MQKRTRSILNELDELLIHRDRSNFIESRANNIINGAIHLMDYINENYDPEQADELQRRLLNAIKNRDAAKFARAIKKFKNDE